MLWARGDLNSGPLGYQPSAPTGLSYEPLPSITVIFILCYREHLSFIFKITYPSFIVSKQKGIYIKEYRSGSGLLVAVCDKDLVGKSFEEDGLHLKVTESFYKGEVATEGEVAESLKHATIANLVGERAIKCAIDNEFIEESSVIFVDGVPHAQIVKI